MSAAPTDHRWAGLKGLARSSVPTTQARDYKERAQRVRTLENGRGFRGDTDGTDATRTNTGDRHALPNRFTHSLRSFAHPLEDALRLPSRSLAWLAKTSSSTVDRPHWRSRFPSVTVRFPRCSQARTSLRSAGRQRAPPQKGWLDRTDTSFTCTERIAVPARTRSCSRTDIRRQSSRIPISCSKFSVPVGSNPTRSYSAIAGVFQRSTVSQTWVIPSSIACPSRCFNSCVPIPDCW